MVECHICTVYKKLDSRAKMIGEGGERALGRESTGRKEAECDAIDSNRFGAVGGAVNFAGVWWALASGGER
jgi:hypothetical protein